MVFSSVICECYPNSWSDQSLQFGSGLLLIYDKCDRERTLNYNMKEHWIAATLPLQNIIRDVSNIIQPLNDIDDDSLNSLPPFVHFLMYKAAKILTHSMRDETSFNTNIQILKSLRDFLNLIETRWLAASKELLLPYCCITCSLIFRPLFRPLRRRYYSKNFQGVGKGETRRSVIGFFIVNSTK